MSEHLKLILIIQIRLLISLICFTVLAIVFNRWWIVLFSLIFYAYIDDKKEVKNETIR